MREVDARAGTLRLSSVPSPSGGWARRAKPQCRSVQEKTRRAGALSRRVPEGELPFVA
jgi:hypothetical protein